MWEYRAKLLHTIDGDTIDVELDLGFHTYRVERLRLAGIDTPELNSRDPAQRIAAAASRDRLAALLANDFVAKTDKDAREKFGRYLVWAILPDGTIANERLISEGLAKPYDGGKRFGV